ncbi:MAG: hypothetical protein EBR91_11450, partial [Flavobacteriia bacterium]|nr:hypothetical protein [Flavobacteriia bacterium]
MKNFLGYRPHGQRSQWYTWPDGAELRLNRWEDIPQDPGFVYAPFEPSDSCPIIWISSKSLVPMSPQQAEVQGNDLSKGGIETMTDFVERVEAIKEMCSNGKFQKLVVSRVVEMEKVPEIGLFDRLCEQYPRANVCWFQSKISGSWVTASPELLLHRRGIRFETMALAGTRLAG